MSIVEPKEQNIKMHFLKPRLVGLVTNSPKQSEYGSEAVATVMKSDSMPNINRVSAQKP
jgi:hypothetical protein